MRLGIDGEPQIGLLHLAGERIDLLQRFDLIAPQADAIGEIVVGGEYFDDVAADTERPALEIALIALIEDVDQARGDLLPRDLLPLFEHQQHSVVGFRRSQAVDATDARDDDAVAALKQRAGGREAELVEFLVDGGFFLDVNVARRECRLRADSNRNS